MEKEIKLVLIPILLIVTGVLFNTLVVVSNHGMPIIGQSSNYETAIPLAVNESYVPLTQDTLFPYLADVIKVGNYIFAIGDILIWLGLAVCLVMLVKNLRRKLVYNTLS